MKVRSFSGLDTWLVAHPVSVAVGLLLVCFLGVVAAFGLPVQLTPDLEEAAVSIEVAWPGAAPSEVENEVLRPLEEQLNDIPGLDTLESQAYYGSGTVSLEFGAKTSPDAAIVQVANRLASVEDLPEAATPPKISPANASGPVLAVITFQGSKGVDVGRYRSYLEDRIAPEFGRVGGVAQVDVVGGQSAEVQIDLDPSALSRAGLRLEDIREELATVLRDRSAGAVEQGKRRFIVRTDWGNGKVEDFQDLVLGRDRLGGPVRLRDVGHIRLGFRRSTSATFINKNPAIIFLLRRQPGYNVLDTTRGIIARLDELQGSLRRDGLEPKLVFDQREYIEGSLRHVSTNLALGAFLAALVLFFFLRSRRAALLVTLSIPASLAATAMGLSLLGRSINVISIAGVTFAVGMVLDSAIVVVEAISYWRKEGLGGKEAALRASEEVGSALVASTLTSLVVFVPLLAWVGQAAQLIADLAISISLALGASLLYSRLVVPSLAAAFWRETPVEDANPQQDMLRNDSPARNAGMFWIDARRWRFVFAFGVPLIAIAVAAVALPPLEYLPNGNRKLVFGVLVPPPGYSTPEIKRVAAYHQDRSETLRTEEYESGKFRRGFFVGSPSAIFAGLVTWDTSGIPKAVEELKKIHSEIPGLFSVVRQSSLFGRRLGGGRSVELDLLGAKLLSIENAAKALMPALKKAIPGAQVRPIPDLGARSQEYRIRPRHERLSLDGVEGSELSTYAAAAIDGSYAGEVTLDDGFRRDVVMRLRPKSHRDASDGEWSDRLHPESIAQLPMVSAEGRAVAFGDVAQVSVVSSPTSILRLDERRALTLQISPPEDVPLESALAKVQKVTENLRLQGKMPRGVEDRISGSAGELEEAKTNLWFTLLFACIVTYLLLAALLENFILPLPIIVSIPLAACGGVLGFRLVAGLLELFSSGSISQGLDIFSAAGFLMLIGLVVNNAILLMDGALAAEKGTSRGEAMKASIRRRMRPIIITTTTSLVGLAPLVVYNGTGSELYRGIGSIVLGGMLLSTVITLMTTPALALCLPWHRSRAQKP